MVKSIGRKRQRIFPLVHKIKDSMKPSERERRKTERAKDFARKECWDVELRHSHNHRLLQQEHPLEITLYRVLSAFVRPEGGRWLSRYTIAEWKKENQNFYLLIPNLVFWSHMTWSPNSSNCSGKFVGKWKTFISHAKHTHGPLSPYRFCTLSLSMWYILCFVIELQKMATCIF